ncbi:MAG: hypothetical protein AB7Q64_23905 [Verrucomicrobiales bacterium]
MKHQTSDLRLTETNSADDSSGRTWGLEGNLFWHVTGGVFAAVITLLLCFSALRWSLGASAALAAVPLTLSLLYVFGLRQGKPPGGIPPKKWRLEAQRLCLVSLGGWDGFGSAF